jgi:Domain of unknown function (DUF5063)
MSEDLDSLIHRFRAAAQNFMKIVDSAPHLEREAFLVSVGRALAELYSVALQLPVIDPDTAEMNETPFPTEAWADLLHSLREKLGPLDMYWELFDSTKKEDLVQGTLSGDLSEIYFDLKHDLHLDRTGIGRADFVWKLRFSFLSHWGRHALEALKTMFDRGVETEIRRAIEM